MKLKAFIDGDYVGVKGDHFSRVPEFAILRSQQQEEERTGPGGSRVAYQGARRTGPDFATKGTAPPSHCFLFPNLKNLRARSGSQV